MKKIMDVGVIAVTLLFVIATGVLFSCHRQTVQDDASWQTATETVFDTDETETQMTETASAWLYVYVCGQVLYPDVYRMPTGARLYEAIREAGGATEDADLNTLNLADVLTDGQRVYIPAVDELSTVSEATNEKETDSRLNINTATLEQLESLPGIGEVKAKAILTYRETNGDFTSVEQLLEVPGIKEGVYGKIQTLIRVD